MATIKKFEDLEIWQLSRQLAKEVFDVYSSVEPFSNDYKSNFKPQTKNFKFQTPN